MSGVRCFHVSIDEMAALNDRLAFTLRSLENSRRNANRRDRV